MANYLLGYGERLVETINLPSSGGTEKFVYSIEEAKKYLGEDLKNTASNLDQLPHKACPNDHAVIALTLHPKYLAKSYYPDSFFQHFNLRVVGSREANITPKKQHKQKPYKGDQAPAPCYFLAGTRRVFRDLAQDFPEWIPKTTRLHNEVRRIENIHTLDDSRLKPIPFMEGNIPLEVVLHARPKQDDFVLEGFRSFLDDLDIKLNLDKRVHVGGICFLPLRATHNNLNNIIQFSFIRVVRRMPKLRLDAEPFRTANIPKFFSVQLPQEKALDETIRVAIFDGGVSKFDPLKPWVRPKKARNIGKFDQEGRNHGIGVTSAALFGPLTQLNTIPRPYSNIDHWRVIDQDDLVLDGFELYAVLHRIRTILDQNPYEFINLSLGPDLPVEDDEIHVWTAVLDAQIAKKEALVTVAVGNTGLSDRESGNARIQPPGDSVNALSIGAADRHESAWQRASYSSIGPGRSPGIIKPDILAFGGTDSEPFFTLDGKKPHYVAGKKGTSFAAPTILRMATGIRAHLGGVIKPLAIKALLVHNAQREKHHDQCEVGWGKVSGNVGALISSPNHEAHIVYQGELDQSQYMRVPIPLPSSQLSGFVTIRATFCYCCPVDPSHALNYTKSGLEIVFRKNTSGLPPINPKTGKRKAAHKSTSFFGKGTQSIQSESELRSEWKWETVRNTTKRFQGKTLNRPVFDIRYLAREESHATENAPALPYALIITVSAPDMKDFYNQVLARYKTYLEVLNPVIEIPVSHSRSELNIQKKA